MLPGIPSEKRLQRQIRPEHRQIYARRSRLIGWVALTGGALAFILGLQQKGSGGMTKEMGGTATMFDVAAYQWTRASRLGNPDITYEPLPVTEESKRKDTDPIARLYSPHQDPSNIRVAAPTPQLVTEVLPTVAALRPEVVFAED